MSITSPRPPVAVAPWAEVVPGYGPVTVDLLLTLPDDGYRYEVVEGVLVRMAGSGLDATTIGGLLAIALGSFVYARRLPPDRNTHAILRMVVSLYTLSYRIVAVATPGWQDDPFADL